MTEVTKGEYVLDSFIIWLSRSSYIKKNGLEVEVRSGVTQEGYSTLPREDDQYDGISISGVNDRGELDFVFIGEHYKTEELIGRVQDDPLFKREGHFVVKSREYMDKNFIEFDGTLFDALLVIANEGAKYDV